VTKNQERCTRTIFGKKQGGGSPLQEHHPEGLVVGVGVMSSIKGLTGPRRMRSTRREPQHSGPGSEVYQIETALNVNTPNPEIPGVSTEIERSAFS